mmetsp:Transcript_36227/g.104393  ORF Transcript_36227/g.104393 Transcript_36227/m.104393 type:complete len:298 (-) Transcript_36227:1395-2288(-)
MPVLARPRGELAGPLCETRAARGAALRPSRPVAHNAILRGARFFRTTLGFHESLGARLAAAAGIHDDLALASPLAATTGFVARIPRGPVRDFAVDDPVASLRLFQRSLAWRAQALRLDVDASNPVAHVEAPMARGPVMPSAKSAIDFLGLASVHIADVHGLEVANTRLAPIPRQGFDLPRPRHEAAPALDRAEGPVPPCLELAIDRIGQVALARSSLVAEAGALSAAVGRLHGDGARPEALVSLPGADLGCPLAPVAQLAVYGVHASALARLGIGEVPFAWLAGATAWRLDLARPLP